MVILLQMADMIQSRHAGVSAWLRRIFVELCIPFHRKIGLRVQEISLAKGIYTLRLPFTKSNRNITGTVNGAAIMCLGEAIHGLMFHHNFPPTQFALVTRNLEVSFLRPGSSDLLATFRFDAADKARLLERISAGSRTRVTFPSEVRDDRGKLVAKFNVEYAVIRLES